MTKRLPLLCLSLLLVLTLSACGSSQALNKEAMAHYVPMTEELITAFVEKDTETLAAASNENLGAYFSNPDNLAETYATLERDGAIKGFAKVKGYSHPNEETEEENVSILQNVRFENRTRTFSLTYNADSKLIGFYAK